MQYTKKICGLLLFFVLIFSRATYAQAPAGETNDFKKIVEKYVKNIPPGWVVLLSNPDTTWVGAGGYAELKTQTPTTTNMKFRIASNSKQMTAVVILQLMEEGKLSLNDNVEKYFPKMIKYGDRITIRMLMNHTAGLRTFNMNFFYGIYSKYFPKSASSPHKMIKVSQRRKPYFLPGEAGKSHYSNTGYTVLGMIIEKVEGKPLAQVLKERIFMPLEMADTELPSEGVYPKAPFAHGYAKNKKGARDQTAMHWSRGYASGGVISTAADMLKYAHGYMDGKLLKESSMQEMWKVALPGSDSISGYGLGVEVGQLPGNMGKMISHTGSIRGYVSFIYMFPQQKSVVVMLFNRFDKGMRTINYGALRRDLRQHAESLKNK